MFSDGKSLLLRLKIQGAGEGGSGGWRGHEFLPSVVASLLICLGLEVFLICKCNLKSKP